MQWTSRILIVGILCAASSATGYQPGCANCNAGLSKPSWNYHGMDAEACASPCGYSLAPGCCEDTRHCCDNAWAGYCEHRARVDAFWYRVGAPGWCGRGKNSCQAPMMPCQSCAAATMDATHPTPAAAPTAPPVPAPPVARNRAW